MEDVVHRVKSTDHHDESLPDLHNQDTLFALAIRAHFDQVERVQGHDRRYKALRRILSMGICDWDAQEKNGVVRNMDFSHFSNPYFHSFNSYFTS